MALQDTGTHQGIERRRVLQSGAFLGVAGFGAIGIAGCGGGGGNGGGSGGGGGAPQAGTSIAPAAQVPVGGGTIFKEQEVVVTQPSEGEFKAFSAVCTHRGCTVGTVADNLIQCPCHGSKYSISTGQVEGGPAPEPLPQYPVSVQNGQVVVQSQGGGNGGGGGY